MKADAWRCLMGNWFGTFLLRIVEFLIGIGIMSFFPFRLPQPGELQSAAQDPAEIIALFMPRTFTPRTVALIAIVVLLAVLIFSPLNVGVRRFFLKVANGEKAKLRDAFSPFCSIKTVFSSIGLDITVKLILLLWSVPLVIIPSVLAGIAGITGIVPVMYLSLLLVIFCALLWVFVTFRYTFAYFIFAEDYSKGTIKSLREFFRLTKKRKTECIKLRATYFIYDLICMYVPVFGFVYFAVSNTVFAKYISHFRGQSSFDCEWSDRAV